MCRCVSALCPDPLSTLHLPKMCLGDYLPLPIWRFASCLGRPSCLISEADARCYPVIRCPHLKAFFFFFFLSTFSPQITPDQGQLCSVRRLPLPRAYAETCLYGVSIWSEAWSRAFLYHLVPQWQTLRASVLLVRCSVPRIIVKQFILPHNHDCQ